MHAFSTLFLEVHVVGAQTRFLRGRLAPLSHDSHAPARLGRGGSAACAIASHRRGGSGGRSF